MKQTSKRLAFTIAELIIVISIIILVFTFVYLPYAHFQEKVKIKQAVREAAQAINEARNMAVNGFEGAIGDTGEDALIDENKSIALYLSNADDKKNKMYFIGVQGCKDEQLIVNCRFADDINITNSLLNGTRDGIGAKLISEPRSLPVGTQFNGLIDETGNKIGDELLLFYSSITGSGEYISGGASLDLNTIKMEFSYKGSTSPVLQKKLQYDTRIHTLDYGNNID